MNGGAHTTTGTLEATTIEAVRDQVRGDVLGHGDRGYDEARTVWNAMIEREPAVIVRCAGTADVVAAVNCARDLDLLVSVKGGGHNVAGNAVCDGGLMIDLSPMNGVRIDPIAKTARVGAGATWGDVDHEAQHFGLATTGGIVSTTGVAGLTLGGGLGYLARTYGLAHDNVRSMDVVTADGEFVRASETTNADLFWGMRGGGGNFGIATSFEFDLHAVGPELLSLRCLYPVEAAPEVLRVYREFMAEAPNEVQAYAAFVQGCPELGLPEQFHGRTFFTLAGVYVGDVATGIDVLQPLRDAGDPLADMTQPMPYLEHQRRLDDAYVEGYRNYWKSNVYTELSDAFIETVMEYVDPIPSRLTMVFFEWMGGAIAEADHDATAFPHRDKAFAFTAAPRWNDPGRDDELIAWCRDLHEAVVPYSADGVYVNYLDGDEAERVRSAYGDRYDRLVDLKGKWDPENLFRMNQNITPTGGEEASR